ncbi:hypothetical protein [Actinomadura soli]|uniref:hypothetical protein n=1 Tax=Actinomadura soli TaxID=2508997 RepID=UPI00197A9560|nr:hypothetical protein [Actinomadura soli]
MAKPCFVLARSAFRLGTAADRRAAQPGGGYASNAELGMLRATVVREVLRSSARIPTARDIRRSEELQVKGKLGAAPGAPPEPVCLLAEGAIVTASISGNTRPAQDAREAAQALVA